MAQYESSYEGARVQATAERVVSPWAEGFAVFAAIMMIIVGAFHVINGLVAVLESEFYVVRPNFVLEFDVTTWGWIHIVGGIIVSLAGIGLFTANIVSRIIGIGVAVLSIIWNFYSIPYYPVWSIITIALGVAVIWALTALGGQERKHEASWLEE
jgi:hypothetical protein